MLAHAMQGSDWEPTQLMGNWMVNTLVGFHVSTDSHAKNCSPGCAHGEASCSKNRSKFGLSNRGLAVQPSGTLGTNGNARQAITGK